MTMKVSLDGQNYVDAPMGVRVIYGGLGVGDGCRGGCLILNMTEEGVIADVYEADGSNESVGTSSETAQEIADRLAGAEA